MSRSIDQLLADMDEEMQNTRERFAMNKPDASITSMMMLEAMRGRAEALAAVVEALIGVKP